MEIVGDVVFERKEWGKKGEEKVMRAVRMKEGKKKESRQSFTL